MKILNFLLLFLALPVIANETKSFNGPITKLVIEIDEGEIDIMGGNNQKTVIDYKALKSNCTFEMFKQGHTIHIYNNKNEGGCETSYNIKLPSNVKIDAKIGAGYIQISNLNAVVQILGGTGNILLRDLRQDVSIKLGAGNVGFNTRFKPIKPIDIVLEIGSGSVKCSLPTHSSIKKDLIKNLPGSLYIAKDFVLDDEKYDFNLDFKMGVGNISIKPINK